MHAAGLFLALAPLALATPAEITGGITGSGQSFGNDLGPSGFASAGGVIVVGNSGTPSTVSSFPAATGGSAQQTNVGNGNIISSGNSGSDSGSSGCDIFSPGQVVNNGITTRASGYTSCSGGATAVTNAAGGVTIMQATAATTTGSGASSRTAGAASTGAAGSVGVPMAGLAAVGLLGVLL